MRICVLGAGYAGLTLARRLDRWLGPATPHEILLVDRSPNHQLIVRMHEVAAATIPPDEALVPIIRILHGSRVGFQQGTATGIDLQGKRVLCDGEPIGFDILVVALGGETADFGIPGVRENALPLRTCDQAVRLGRHVERQVVRAARAGDPALREGHLTVAIGGGGYTGAELAGELLYRLRELTTLHGISEAPRVLLLEARDQLLPGFPSDAARRAQGTLEEMGVEVRLCTPVTGICPGRVMLASGEGIPAGTIVWAGGVRAHPLVARCGLATGLGGRACVDEALRWDGRPDTFAIGDAALVLDRGTGGPVPASAQHAIRQAEHLAYSLYRLLDGRALVPYRPEPTREVISLGRREAVAVLGPVVLEGMEARILKNLSYRRYEASVGA